MQVDSATSNSGYQKLTDPYLQADSRKSSTPADANNLYNRRIGWAAYMSGAVGEILARACKVTECR